MYTANFSLFSQFFNKTIIVGLSGGPDSVFLLKQLAALKDEHQITIITAHLNHKWRPTADRDQIFCAQLCHELNIPFETICLFDLEKQKNNGSLEAQARAYRRTFFESCAQKYNADYIVLGHHQDDQLETFFIRLVRGTTHAGISGIQSIDGKYAHPLLSLSKQEILNWLDTHHVAYMHDETNDSTDFLRNKIRKLLIPEISSIDPRAHTNILSFMDHMSKVHTFISEQAVQMQQNMSTQHGIAIIEFLSTDEIIQEQILTNLVIHHKIPITLKKSWFAECIKFLKQRNTNMHAIASHWNLVTQKNCFRFEKALSK
jgi:tRNA(Ile)-lysidine synthase